MPEQFRAPMQQSSPDNPVPGALAPLAGIASASALNGLVTVLQQIQNAIAAQTDAINSKFPNWVTPPTTTTSTGTAGQVAYDAAFFYLCVATNTWGRVALDFAF